MFSRPSEPTPRPSAIASWLTFVAVLIFLMVIVGGITRLTESGLSIARWDPVRQYLLARTGAAARHPFPALVDQRKNFGLTQ